MNVFFQGFCAIFSGILTSLAIPNELFHFGSALFGIFALVPLYIAAREAKSYKNAAALFALDAFTTHLLSSFWLANFRDFAIFTLGASAFGTACIGAMAGCLFFAPFKNPQAISRKKISRQMIHIQAVSLLPEKINFRVLYFACTRVVYEWAKSTGFLAYPWGTLSMSAFRTKVLMQSADIFGVYGITFLFAFISGTLAETILSLRCEKESARKKIRQCQMCAIAMLACFVIYGAFRLGQDRKVLKILNAVLVQQNRDPWADKNDSETITTSIKLTEKGIEEFADEGMRPDIVVWSEAVLRSSFPNAYIKYSVRPNGRPLIPFIKESNVPFLIGGSFALDKKNRRHANSALMFDKEGIFRGHYGKTHLVPFAEVIPGAENPLVSAFMKKVVKISSGWIPGSEFTLFELEADAIEDKGNPPSKIIDLSLDAATTQKPPERTKVRISTPICFEDAFPDICGPFHKLGAEVFLNITDDSWSKTASAEYQHFVVAAFRAIEYRTTLVRSTNSGFTAVVDPCGRILNSIPLFEESYLCARIPIYQWQETTYSRYTNWFVHLILIFMAVVCVHAALRIKKESRRKTLRECIASALNEI